MTEEKVKQRLEQLQAQREEIAQSINARQQGIAQAQSEVAGLQANLLKHDGAIAEFTALLKAEEAERAKIEQPESAQSKG